MKTPVTLAAVNPLDGVTPSFEALGVQFEGAVQMVLGIVWMGALVAGVLAMLITGGQWAIANQVTHHEESIAAGSKNFRRAAVAFAVIAGISIVVGAVLLFVQRAGG